MQNDQYFVLRDFDSYVNVQKEVGKIYENRDQWLKMSLTNIAQSGYFSSDRTIKEYAKEIWKIKPKVLSKSKKNIIIREGDLNV